MATFIPIWREEDNLPVKVAGIFLTRKCNNACSYCGIQRVKLDRELTIGEWFEAALILEKVGIEKLVILGGEPTCVLGIERLVENIIKNTSLDLMIVSNSMAKWSVLSKLAGVGLQRYSTSIDSISGNHRDKYSLIKSNRAIEVLSRMAELGVRNLTGHCVLQRQNNIDEAPEIARFLTGIGVWVYFIPFHHGEEDFWINRSNSSAGAFMDEDADKLKRLGEKLISLKDEGILIANSDEYLACLHQYAIRLNWHCTASTSELRIDADGALTCCNDIRGVCSDFFSVFDLRNRNALSDFQWMRQEDAKKCPGCFWPSHFHAAYKRFFGAII